MSNDAGSEAVSNSADKLLPLSKAGTAGWFSTVSGPLYTAEQMRAYAAAAVAAEREAILAAILRLPSPGPELSDGYVSGHHWGRAGAIDAIRARSARPAPPKE
jgi:hypothetical protein